MKHFVLYLLVLPNLVFADNSELAAAREGAPQHISANASIMVWEKGRYKLKLKGTNSFTCIVWSNHHGTYEPTCMNSAAKAAVLPVYELQRQMLEKHIAIQDIHATIAEKAERGELPLPEPGAVVYMMSNKNKYYDHFGKKLSGVEPHIMLYYPRLKQSDLGFNGKDGLPGFYNDFPHLSVVHIQTQGTH